MRNRIKTHKNEQLKRIINEKDRIAFVESVSFYEHIILNLKNPLKELFGFSLDYKIRNQHLKDSFFKGKAKSMDLLAYETVRQIVESELKRAGG